MLLSNLSRDRGLRQIRILVPCWFEKYFEHEFIANNRIKAKLATWFQFPYIYLRILTHIFRKTCWQARFFYQRTKHNFYLVVGRRWQVVRGILIQFTLTAKVKLSQYVSLESVAHIISNFKLNLSKNNLIHTSFSTVLTKQFLKNNKETRTGARKGFVLK